MDTFYNCIRRTTIMFLDMFKDIRINRYDVNGTIKGQYLVPLRYGPKSKAYLWVKDHGRNEEMLPMLSVYITSIEFDPNRLTNKYQDILVNTNNQTMKGVFAKNAVPYNISFTLNLWTLHMVDVDQIMEHILPYFQPHAFIRVRIPEVDVIFDVKVICNGCSPVMTDDVGEEEARVIKWDINFTVQAWLMKSTTEEQRLIGTTNIGGSLSASTIDSWIEGKNYYVGNVIYIDGNYYRCIKDHIASSITKPETGGEWQSYWSQPFKTPLNFAWSGTDGGGTSGKLVQRYYSNIDAFTDRDNPEMELKDDPRPIETMTTKMIGIDDDARIILYYEIFNESDIV